MGFAVVAEPPPLTLDSDGVMRIGTTRVTLATVVAAFHEGVTPEAIVRQYPSVALADAYAVIGYYLRHKGDVDGYLWEQQAEANRVRQRNETRFNPLGMRERLLARRFQQQA